MQNEHLSKLLGLLGLGSALPLLLPPPTVLPCRTYSLIPTLQLLPVCPCSPHPAGSCPSPDQGAWGSLQN